MKHGKNPTVPMGNVGNISKVKMRHERSSQLEKVNSELIIKEIWDAVGEDMLMIKIHM